MGLAVAATLAGVLPAPAGSDPELWVLSAHNLAVGAPPVVPPLLPTLLRPAIALGFGPVAAAQAISTLAHACTAAVVCVWVARSSGRAALGVLAGVLAAALPPVAGLAVRAQPDALVALWLSLATITAHLWVARPHPLRQNPSLLGALLVLITTGALLRVHGLVVAVILVAALGVGGGRLFRIGRVGLGVAALHLAPLWVGLRPGWLVELPWYTRLFHTLGSSATSGAAGLPEEVGRHLATKGIADPTLWDRPAWAFQQAPESWAWVVAGCMALAAFAFTDRRRVALGVGLVPLVPALLSWAEPRHVAVVVPLCVGLWALGLSHAGWTCRAVGIAGVFAAFATLGSAHFTWTRLQAEARMVASQRTFGEALCAEATPGDLGAGVRAAFLYCPLPVHQPDGSGADWRTWAVGRRPPGPGWVPLALGGQRVYRLSPTDSGPDRPCQQVAAVSATPYFASPESPATLDGPCTVPERTWRVPDAAAATVAPSPLEQNRRRPGRRP